MNSLQRQVRHRARRKPLALAISATLAMGMVHTAQADFPANVQLSSLDGVIGFKLDGEAEGDGSGGSVSVAGDINGDGVDDLIIGANGADPNGSGSGRSYVVFGRTSGFVSPVKLSELDGTNGFKLDGETAGDYSGISVSAAGDVNGDGVDDLIVGAFGANPNGSGSGRSYVVFGQTGGFSATLQLSALDGANGFVLDGEAAYDYSGFSVSRAGDINGDGVDDLIIGANGADPNGSGSGRSYVVFGRTAGFSSPVQLSALNGANGFALDGEVAVDFSGRSVSAAGDLNGDGVDDLIVGAPLADPDGLTSSGRSYVVFGQTGGFPATVPLSGLNGANGFMLDGEAAYDYSGRSVSAAGDVNGDGVDDLIVGAPFADPDGLTSSGRSYVVFGQTGGFPATVPLSGLNGANGFTLDGEEGDFSGYSVSAAGDVNGDGVDDLIVGAFGADPNGTYSGRSYVVFGSTSGFSSPLQLSDLDGTNGFMLDGEAADDRSGRSVSAAGDVNGDGVDDLIIGASGADTNGPDSGRSYVVFGRAPSIPLAGLDGTDGFKIDGEAPGDQAGFALGFAGDINGDGMDDFIIGAEDAKNSNLEGSGRGYVIYGRPEGFPPVLRLADLTATDGLILDGESAGDKTGARAAAAAGDINGDGMDDLVIGAIGALGGAGRVYVVFGRPLEEPFPLVLDLSSLDGSDGFKLDGEAAYDNSGRAASAAGDVNGDGIDDLIVGAPYATNSDAVQSGRAYVVFGSTGPFASPLPLSTLDGSNGLILDGSQDYDQAGRSVSAAGDINGDGIDDILITGTGTDRYVVFGQTGVFTSPLKLSELNGTDGFILRGEATGANGRAAGLGDFNGDGIDDLIFRDINPVNSLSGAVVVFGRTADNPFPPVLQLSGLDGTNGFRMDGEDSGDGTGFALGGAGDVNGDGVDDLIIGAREAAPNGLTDSGRSYVVFGRSVGFPAVLQLSALGAGNGFKLDGEGAGDRSGIAAGGAGDINGDGFADVIVGAYGADPDDDDSDDLDNDFTGRGYVVFGSAAMGEGPPEDVVFADGFE